MSLDPNTLEEMRWKIAHGQSELRTYFNTLDDGDHLVAIVVRRLTDVEFCACVQVSGCADAVEAALIVNMIKRDIAARFTARAGVEFDVKAHLQTSVEDLGAMGSTAVCLLGMFPTETAAMGSVPELQGYGVDLMTPMDQDPRITPEDQPHA